MIKRALYIILVLVFVFSFAAFSGCEVLELIGGDEETADTKDTQQQAEEETIEETNEVSFGLIGISEPSSEAALFITDYIEENFDIKITTVTLSEEGYKDELEWMIGANMLPDVFYHDATGDKFQYKVLITAGLIQEIPKSVWANLENLSSVMSWYEDIYSYEGDMYFIPRTYQTYDQTHGATNIILYRSDWAGDLYHSTYDDTADFTDIIDLLSSYRTTDTDENSIWDTWGITGSGGMDFIWDMFLTPFGVEEWMEEDGSWIPGIISSDAKTAISWAAQLFRQGLIDTDVREQSAEDALGKFVTGRTGAVMTSGYYEDLLNIEAEWDEHNPDTDITSAVKIIPVYTTPSGERHNGIETFEGGTMISSSVDEDTVEKILNLFDFMYSEKGRNLFDYGDTAGQSDETVSLFLDTGDGFMGFSTIASFNLDKNASSTEEDSEFVTYALQMIEENVWPWSFDEELFTNGMITPEMCVMDIDLIAEETVFDLITTSQDFDADWDLFVEYLYNELNLEEAIDEVNERAQEYYGD